MLQDLIFPHRSGRQKLKLAVIPFADIGGGALT